MRIVTSPATGQLSFVSPVAVANRFTFASAKNLQCSLGIAGQFEHPSLIAAIEKIRDTCDQRGIAPGIHFRAMKLTQYWRERGLRFLSCNSEVGLLFDQAQQSAKTLRG